MDEFPLTDTEGKVLLAVMGRHELQCLPLFTKKVIPTYPDPRLEAARTPVNRDRGRQILSWTHNGHSI